MSILVDVLAGSDETVRFLAAQELGHHAWAPHVIERVIQTLLAATSDADAYVRSCAISALRYALLGYHMRADFYRTVVDAVAPSLHEKEVGARYGAAETLGYLGGVRAAQALVSGLDDDEAHVRRMVAGALSMVAEPVTRGPINAQRGARVGRDHAGRAATRAGSHRSERRRRSTTVAKQTGLKHRCPAGRDRATSMPDADGRETQRPASGGGGCCSRSGLVPTRHSTAFTTAAAPT